MDLTKGEDIKKRWQEYTELYKKDLNDPDNHDGVITHLQPDILECEVKWALGSITTNKASGGDGIPAELFKILKDDAVKVLHSICQQIWKTQQWPQDWKRLVFIPIPRKVSAKECSNYHTIALISHASKVMLKILQYRLQQYVNQEIPDVQAGFRIGRGTRDQIANIYWIIDVYFHFSLVCIGEGNGNPFQCSCLENPRDGGAWWAAIYGVAQSRTRLRRLSSSSSNSIGSYKKQENSRKTTASLIMLKPLAMWITTNCGKFLKT